MEAEAFAAAVRELRADCEAVGQVACLVGSVCANQVYSLQAEDRERAEVVTQEFVCKARPVLEDPRSLSPEQRHILFDTVVPLLTSPSGKVSGEEHPASEGDLTIGSAIVGGNTL